MRSTRFFCLALPILVAMPDARADAQVAAGNLADRLRSFSYALDYSSGVATARANARQLRNSRALAWYALLLARSDQARSALALADSLLAADRRSAWSWFARTAALGYGYRDSSAAAVTASAAMYRRAPRHPDVVWLRAATLMYEGQPAAAIAVVDSFLARTPASVPHLGLRAKAAYDLANLSRPPNQAQKDSAIALWAWVRSLDSTDLEAWFAPGNRLLNDGRIEEGTALLSRAAELAPDFPWINQEYWRALRTLHIRHPERARAVALPGIERVLEARGSDPGVLGMIAWEYGKFGMPEAQRAMEDRVLRDHPRSAEAEWVLVSRYRAVDSMRRDTTVRDPALKNTYRHLLQEFVARPTHVNQRLLGETYIELFHLADSTTHPDTLLSLILGMERYEGKNLYITFAEGAIALADRRVHLDQAERLAREGVRAGRRVIDRTRPPNEGIGEYAQALDRMTSTMADALGWVYFRAGRLKDAERELRKALELDPRNVTALHHLGQWFEAANRLDSAEVYYSKGAVVPALQSNPNHEALRILYRARRGSFEGFDEYNAGIKDRDRARRRAAVKAELLTTRDSVPSFTLVTLDGVTVRSDTLRGRLTVINFWGKWCGPCVAELPEVQRFSRHVAPDTTVRFITINNDENLQELREWMRRNRYDIPVLVDGGYASRARVHDYPTTWFLDRAGRIAFVKAG